MPEGVESVAVRHVAALGNEQDFSAVILQMEEQAHLGSTDKRQNKVSAASAKK